jgi:hypothetical protein
MKTHPDEIYVVWISASPSSVRFNFTLDHFAEKAS